jgi:hypothetical protein
MEISGEKYWKKFSISPKKLQKYWNQEYGSTKIHQKLPKII